MNKKDGRATINVYPETKAELDKVRRYFKMTNYDQVVIFLLDTAMEGDNENTAKKEV
jgi:hypothetical protein